MNTHTVQVRRVSGCGLAVLIAASLAMGSASAMEAGAFNQLATASSSNTLPKFLDVDRLPDLQQAWRNSFSATPAADAVIPSQHPNGADAGNSSVRSRAEELSHRFTFDDEAPPQPATSTYVTPQPGPEMPAATASIGQNAAPAAPPVEHVLSPIDVEPIEEPVTSSIAVDSDGADAADDQIARALDGEPEPAATGAAAAAPVSSATVALPTTPRTVNIARPVRKDLTGVAQKPRSLNNKPDADDSAKVAAQKRDKRASAAAVAVKKAPAAPKQVATSKSSGPLYYFNNSSSNSATAPDRHILMPSEIKSFGWGE